MFLTFLLTAFAFVFGGVGFVLLLLETVQRLLQSLIHLFLCRLTRLVLLGFLTRLVTFVVRVHLGGVVLYTFPFTAFCSGGLLLLVLLLLTLLTLFAFLLFGFLGRTRGGVDGVQINLTQHFRSILQFGFAECKYLLFLGLRSLRFKSLLLAFCLCSNSLSCRFLRFFTGFLGFFSRTLGCHSGCFPFGFFGCFLRRESLCLRLFFRTLGGLNCRFLCFFACLTGCRLTVRLYLCCHVFVELFGKQQIKVVVNAYVRVRLNGMSVLLAPSGESGHSDI